MKYKVVIYLKIALQRKKRCYKKLLLLGNLLPASIQTVALFTLFSRMLARWRLNCIIAIGVLESSQT